jgi:hypothetical protein
VYEWGIGRRRVRISIDLNCGVAVGLWVWVGACGRLAIGLRWVVVGCGIVYICWGRGRVRWRIALHNLMPSESLLAGNKSTLSLRTLAYNGYATTISREVLRAAY